MNDEITSHDNSHRDFTLKVLFGPMFGCELYLPADDYFVIVSQSSDPSKSGSGVYSADDNGSYYLHNTLYLPCNEPSSNFILKMNVANVDSDNEEADFIIEVQDSAGAYSEYLNINEIYTSGHICFAIKYSEDEWPENIKNFNSESLTLSEPIANYNNTANLFENRFLICLCGLLLILVITALFVWYKEVEQENRIITLHQTLEGAPVPVDIIPGRESQEIYVLSKNHPEMLWVKKAIYELHNNGTVFPVLLPQHRKETVSQLSKAGYPVLQVDYTRPQHPVIAIYEPLEAKAQEKLTSSFLELSRFAKDATIVVKTKIQLLQEARQGLERQNIHYRQVMTVDGYALIVRDALSDNALVALQKFIQQFTSQWGNQVVNFSIHLDENWLQNKSYLDSSNGYLFLNPRHWYFPLKKEI